MPTASDQDRAKMAQYFGGDGIDDGQPTLFLIGKGWTFPFGICTPPEGAGKPSEKELDCVYFLCDEWDYGYAG